MNSLKVQLMVLAWTRFEKLSIVRWKWLDNCSVLSTFAAVIIISDSKGCVQRSSPERSRMVRERNAVQEDDNLKRRPSTHWKHRKTAVEGKNIEIYMSTGIFSKNKYRK